jgi:hypothetical protein
MMKDGADEGMLLCSRWQAIDFRSPNTVLQTLLSCDGFAVPYKGLYSFFNRFLACCTPCKTSCLD